MEVEPMVVPPAFLKSTCTFPLSLSFSKLLMNADSLNAASAVAICVPVGPVDTSTS